jgi:hypothetical protein
MCVAVVSKAAQTTCFVCETVSYTSFYILTVQYIRQCDAAMRFSLQWFFSG